MKSDPKDWPVGCRFYSRRIIDNSNPLDVIGSGIEAAANECPAYSHAPISVAIVKCAAEAVAELMVKRD